ncbi:MAG: hypothetical protein IPM63_05225 [Acidobacteriota bacterium]|nr:MAG: hypothetical protein IPM63_05225 [Acidobacteriota bacterium]
MSRKLAFAGIGVMVLISLVIMGIWQGGWLFLRVASAKITLNGKTTKDSKIYKGASGDYFIFLENESAEHRVYRVFSQTPEVGIPASPVPSSYTKSLKTNWVLLCGHCPITTAGTDKFDRNATVSVSSTGLEFTVGEDNVVVKLADH